MTSSAPFIFGVAYGAPVAQNFSSQAVVGLSYVAVPPAATTHYFGPPPATAPNAGCPGTGTPGDAGLAQAVQSLTVAVNANTQALNALTQRMTPPVGPPVPPPPGGIPPLKDKNDFGPLSGASLSSVADPATGLPATTLDFSRALLTVQQSLGQGQKGAAIGVYSQAAFQHQSNQQSIDAMKAALNQAGFKVP